MAERDDKLAGVEQVLSSATRVKNSENISTSETIPEVLRSHNLTTTPSKWRMTLTV